MKKLLLAIILIAGISVSAFATDVVIQATTVPNANFQSIGTTRTGTVSVTNGSASVTCSACLPASLVNVSGYKIAIAGVDYTVSATTSTSAFTLSSNYAGSTNASASFSLYPVVLLRVFSNQSFTPRSGTYTVQAGVPNTQGFFKQVGCSVISNTVYIPEITLPATADVNAGIRYSAWFYRLEGSQLQPYGCFESWALRTTTPTSWPAICTELRAPVLPMPENAITTASIQSYLANISSASVSVSDANKALVSGSDNRIAASSVTSTELGYVSGVTSAIQTQMDTKAPTASPTFTGTPAAPTASAATNTTQIATTAFVQAQKASPAFTGTPTAPTASSGTSTTQIATTAFVQQEVPAATVDASGKALLGARASYAIGSLPTCNSSRVNLTVNVTDGNKGERNCRNTVGSTYAWVDPEKGIVDPTNFGASPSASAAVNATAINAALAAGGAGAIIELPSGTYSIDSTISFTANNQVLRGSSRGTTLSYTGAANAISYNSKYYCKVENLSISTSTGQIGLYVPTVSHWWKAIRVDVTGFSVAGVKIEQSFYGELTGGDIASNGDGVVIGFEANENRIFSNNIRQNVRGVVITDTGGPPPNGNIISHNGIESVAAGTLRGVTILGGDSNIVADNRIEIVGASYYHIHVGLGASATSQFNQFSNNVFLGTAKAYRIGDGAGSSQVNYTTIRGGRGGEIVIEANATLTQVEAPPGSYTLTDGGVDSIILLDAQNGRWYQKRGSDKKWDLTLGGSGTILNTGTNYLQIGAPVSVNTAPLNSSMLSVLQSGTTTPGIEIRLAGSSTANALSVRDSGGTALTSIDSSGRINMLGLAAQLNSSGSTIGHASGGSYAIAAASHGGNGNITINPASGSTVFIGNNNNTNLKLYGGLILGASQDAGVFRNASGVVEVNNGSAGQYRDLYARDLFAATAGGSLTIKTGSNACAGSATLSSGAATVSTTCVGTTWGTNFIIQLTPQGSSTGVVRVSSFTGSTSFVITSSDGASTDAVGWTILKLN